MSKWNENTIEIENSDPVYQGFFNKTGSKKIDHLALTLFGDAMNSNFLNKISIKKRVYTSVDKLNKIAFEEYGDAKLWWVIAWFNGRPLDSHYNPGDEIFIPQPLEEVLLQYESRESL